MPNLHTNGTTLHYVERGVGDETLVFSHGFLLDSTHFAPQIEELSEQHRCIAYDHRGHGKSERPTGGYHLENLYADAVGLIESLGNGPVHFVGLSTGSFIGLRLGIRRPDLLKSLTLIGTSAAEEPIRKRIRYELMLQFVRATGFAILGDYLMSLAFASQSLGDPARQEDIIRMRTVLHSNDPEVALAFGHAVVHRRGVLEQLHRIQVPTSVVVGLEDALQPVACARKVAEAIRDATLVLIPNAGHVATIDQPYFVTEAILDQLARSSPALRDTLPQVRV
ncbi:MAG: alpha/beta fold hydrolase [Myxococcota bacterium]